MAHPPQPIGDGERVQTGHGRGGTLVLVVDDDRAIRAVVRRTLESAGYAVLEAANGAAAFAMLDANPVALVITDVLMPERDGIELVLGVSASEARVPIIVMSGGGMGLDVETLVSTALAFGAAAAIAKPFSIDALLALVGEVLGQAPPRGRPGEGGSDG